MEKQFLKRFYLTLAIALIVVAGIVALFDPFYHYHDAIFNMKRVLQDRDYQVAGTLDHFSYDAILLGNSIAENHNIDQIKERFGLIAVKAIRAGGSNADFLYYLDRAFQHQRIESVFYFMDYSAMEAGRETTFDRMDTDYIINANPFDDTKYLFNKDILLKKIPLQFVYSYGLPYDESNPYSWYQIKDFSTAAVTGRYYPRDVFLEEQFDEEAYQGFLDNVNDISERVRNHPETEFIAAMDSFRNAKVYFFQNDRELSENLEHYMDSVHFSYEVSRELIDRIAGNENLMNMQNCKECLEDLKNMVKEFSSEGILKYYPDAVVR